MGNRTGASHGLWLALAFFVVSRLAVLAGVWLRGGDPTTLLVSFDAAWYLRVIEDGYIVVPGERSGLAFFPLVPVAARALVAAGMPAEFALVGLAVLGSLLAVVAVWLVGREVADPGVATWLALLWLIAPRSHVLMMGYTEGAFTAAAMFALLGVLRRRWALVAVAGLVAGLVRPTAAPLIATLGLVWLVDVAVTWRREGRLRPFTPRFWALVVASSGFAAYLAYVAWRMGSLTGYLEVQAAWNQRLGTPLDTLRWYAALEPGQPGFALYASVGVVVLCYVVGWGLMFVTRERWELILYAGLSILLVLLQQNYFYSSARFLLPTVLPLLPVARFAGRGARALWVPLFAVLTVAWMLWSVSVMLADHSP